MHALWQRIRLFGGSRPPHLDGMNDVEPLLREGLFSSTQLESHARSLATDRKLAPRPGPEMLLRRLAENEDIISRSYEEVAEAIRQGHPQAPAAKWLVENYMVRGSLQPLPRRRRIFTIILLLVPASGCRITLHVRSFCFSRAL